MAKRKMTTATMGKKKARKRSEKVAKIAIPQPERGVKYFERGLAQLLRSLKKAKGFERQRIAKRIADEKKVAEKRRKREAKENKKKQTNGSKKENRNDENGESGQNEKDQETAETSEKQQRLEREVEVLKRLDLELSARVHLANAVLRIKDLAEAPGPLPAHVQAIVDLPPVKRRGQGDATDIHNVTSSLYNRKEVRDSVSKAISGMCRIICVPIPERYQRSQLSGKEWPKDEEDLDNELEIIDSVSESDSSEDGEEEEEEEAASGKGNKAKGESDAEDAEEKALLQRFEARLGGSSNDDDSEEEEDIETLRSKYKEALAAPPPDTGSEDEESEEDDLEEEAGDSVGFYIDENLPDNAHSSASSSEEDDDDDDDDEPPRKRQATSSSKSKAAAGDSRFLPSLMGGYISDGGESAESDDAAATRMLTQRKNRRGQRARQAIWEQKYKEQARHLQEATNKTKAKDIKWDAKRGAVEAGEGPRWLRRKQGKLGGGGGSGGGRDRNKEAGGEKDGSKSSSSSSKPKNDGPLHPSWEAAKKAKEKAQAVAFTGKKIVFD